LEEIQHLNIIKRNVKYKIGIEEIANKGGLPDDITKQIDSYLMDPIVMKTPTPKTEDPQI
jgi:hypothetical protein